LPSACSSFAKRSGYFPPELVDTFEPVIQEEGRHILFFVNWAAWHRRNLPWWRRPIFACKVAAVCASLPGNAAGWRAGGQRPGRQQLYRDWRQVHRRRSRCRRFMDLCLAENDRRLSGYDSRLLRPATMPWLVRFARHTFVRKRRNPTPVHPSGQ